MLRQNLQVGLLAVLLLTAGGCDPTPDATSASAPDTVPASDPDTDTVPDPDTDPDPAPDPDPDSDPDTDPDTDTAPDTAPDSAPLRLHPSPGEGLRSGQAAPAICFESLSIDFGRFREDEVKDGVIHFESCGDAPLRILGVKTTCGCTGATPDKTEYAPGERGTIAVTFDPSAPGEQKKFVDVITNAGEPVRLSVHANVDALVIVRPKMMRLGVIQYGVAHQREISVAFVNDTYRIERVTASNPQVQARVDPARSRGLEHVVVIDLSDRAGWGGVMSWIDLEVSGRPTANAPRETYHRKVRMQGQLFGALRAVNGASRNGPAMDAFRFGVEKDTPFTRSVTLQRTDGARLEIERTVVEFPAMPASTVVVNRIDDATVELVLTGTGASVATVYRGAVHVSTNVPGEERVSVPISGRVR